MSDFCPCVLHADYIQQCVEQSALEKFDGVSRGKYTIGLGQTKMSFCDDREGKCKELLDAGPRQADPLINQTFTPLL